MDRWTHNDLMEMKALSNQHELARKYIFILISIFTIFGNTLTLVTTWRERSLHQPNKYFVGCLAVADLSVGMFLEPLMLYLLYLDDKSRIDVSIHLCRFMIWIDTLALTASVLSLTFISYDRYLKISKPIHYQTRMTTFKSLKIIITIWLISIAFATYAATPDSGSSGIMYITSGTACPYNENNMKRFYTFIAASLFFLPMVVILVMYVLIFTIAHKRQKMLLNGQLGEICNDRNQRTVFHQDLKVIRMLLVVVGVFILCWCPYFIYTLFFYYHPNYSSVGFVKGSLGYWCRRWATESIVLTLPYINSMCNPVIYACLDQKYRVAFKNLYQRMMCRLTGSRRPQLPETISLRALNAG